VTGPVAIDGTTQPGFAGSPIVTLDGAGTSLTSGLDLVGGSLGSIVRGLDIVGFLDGISLSVDGSVTVAGNFIRGNLNQGTVIGSRFNTVGGTTAAGRR
jgi:hypothetical protein